ncbi:ABC transporter related protein [Desulfovibrio sp. X2]|uniref:ABC transporter ATP-binding protein n=1 Tax=Desulfovibrio sp. X2 TaxID=941449 RepID=UPI0003587826|nr:ABC transporter ATP-binding protein [Desulfovibrio sp. X2]EPR44693.1 ABC transporter related protein [Desulfovibrio sp. X2]
MDGHRPVIEVKGVTNRFGRQVVHENLDLAVLPGEILGVIGGSGAGKSVLLQTIIGLRRPQAGTVRVLGHEVHDASARELHSLERRWGVLFQDGALFSSLTVTQNVQTAMREHLRLPQRLMDELAAMKLAMVGLPPEAGCKYPSELSGGMRKRAGLARALALDPDILFLDEPTSGLDPIGAAGFDQLVLNLHRTLRPTVFMVTHDLDSLYTVCDRVAVLAERRICAIGTLEEILRVDEPWIKTYFLGPRGRAAAACHDTPGAEAPGPAPAGQGAA